MKEGEKLIIFILPARAAWYGVIMVPVADERLFILMCQESL